MFLSSLWILEQVTSFQEAILLKEVDIGPAAGRLLRGYRSGSPLFSVKQLVRMRNSAKWNLVFLSRNPNPKTLQSRRLRCTRGCSKN
uniref:Uncharacterized protein n=1 Tax=Amphimedon queenslandica TaxID=400682 RepID=A0A1X7T933_AMPQE